jgi:cobalamin synthase
MRKIVRFIGLIIVVSTFILAILSFATVIPISGESEVRDFFGRQLKDPPAITVLITGDHRQTPGFLWELFDTITFFSLLFMGVKLMLYGEKFDEKEKSKAT